MLPFFSIIIGTYNHAIFLRRCLDSLMAQTYPNWEAIIINNYSSDNTLEIIASYNEPRFRVINYANEGVIGASKNRGIEVALGEFVCILDSDDWWLPSKLEKVLPYCLKSDLIYHNLEIVYPSGRSGLLCECRDLGNKPEENLLYNGNGIPHSSCVIRRELVLKHLYNENKEFIGVEDFDLWLRLAHENVRFQKISKALGFYWIGTSNLTEISEKQIARLETVYKSHLKKIDFKWKAKTEGALAFQKGSIYRKMKSKNNAIRCFLESLTKATLKVRLKSFRLILWDFFKCY